MASMEHPLFSLATKPDMRHLEYRNGDNMLRITPSGHGLPTIFDKDILIFVISQLMAAKNRKEEIGKRVRFSARELSIATNRPIGGNHYKRLEKAFMRLQGTQFVTNIRTGDKIETRIFSLIDEGGFVRTADEKFRLDYCEVVLSDWFMRALESNQVVTISNDYFRLRRPLERRLYEICRKHCGSKPKWHIGLAKLQGKTGSNAPIKRFRHNIRRIITEDNTPFYRLELTDDDLLICRPRKSAIELAPDIKIPEWADEQARDIAHQKRWDYHVFRERWVEFAKQQTVAGKPPKNAGAAFVAWAKKQGNAP
ncbi:MAG: replication initiator protein A [Ahrensia sp.]|nr:replication initiator protein A [Ahrensia sp.]